MDQPNTQNPLSNDHVLRVALMWRGDPRAPDKPTNHPARLAPLMAALKAERIECRPVTYFDSNAGAAHEALLDCDGVLVWINPLQDGLYDRSKVDPLLREVAAAGVWVSAHPDTILKMGTKEVLYQTKDLGWGADTDIYRSHDEFALRLPVKLAVAGPRVLKPLRGNDSRGVIKVELVGAGRVRIQEAYDDHVETLDLDAFVERMGRGFGGGLIDQAFQPNVSAGMVRCYMSQDRVVGFSEQAPRNSSPTPDAPALGMNSAKAMHGADAEKFSGLRATMEGEWTPALQRVLGLETNDLPALWDADFLYRAAASIAPSPFVLCEINVSSVLPFPDVSAPAIAATARRAVLAASLPRRR
jgi:hypothetical protein